MKKRIVFFVLALSFCMLFGCGATQFTETDEVDSYPNAELFETALNDHVDTVGKTVTFIIKKYVPDSAHGFNMQAGEHLNFCSRSDPDVNTGDTVCVTVANVTTYMGLYIVNYNDKPTIIEKASRELPTEKSTEVPKETVKSTEAGTKGTSYEITDIYFNPGINSIGDYSYVGIVEITNTGSTNLFLKDCTFDFEDNNGHLLQTDDTMISSCPDIIAPGEKGYFYNSLGGSINENLSLDNGLNLKPDVKVVKATGKPIDFEVSDLSVVNDTFGPKITGRIKNTTDKDDSVYVQVLFYDENDRVIAIEGTNVYDLEAGQQKSFDVSGIMLPEYIENGNYSSYKVLARADYYQFVW